MRELWYEKPAIDFINAMPIGNGKLGGMVYNGVSAEKISLNSDSLWSGYMQKTQKSVPKANIEKVRNLIENKNFIEAEKFVEDNMLGFFNESYMPMGNLNLNFDFHNEYTDYKRNLNLEDATVNVKYTIDGVHYKRKFFASHPDNAIFVKLCADENTLNFDIALTSLLKHSVEAKGDSVILRGIAPSHVEPNYVECEQPIIYDENNQGIIFTTVAQVLKTDGEVKKCDDVLSVINASFCVLALVTTNNFEKYDKPLSKNQTDIDEHCFEQLNKINTYSYDELLKRHKQDYQNLYKRVDIQLGEKSLNNLPTDKRLKNLNANKNDSDLFALYFQYGRYLLIASSRQGSQPANLQGIWSEELRPAWSSNYTININTQMNYWHANTTNLSECEHALIDMIEELVQTGATTAKEIFGCNGFVANHNVDLWRQTAPVGGKPKFAYWPMGGVWLATHAYEQFVYTGNVDYLKEKSYEIIKQAALFCSDWLYLDSDGLYSTCPSTTPENVFYDENKRICSISKSSTLDIAIIRHIFEAFLDVSAILCVDKQLSEKVKNQLKKLPNYKIGSDTCLQEWSEDFEEVEKGHRHFSPLYGLFPGYSILQQNDKKLIEACDNLLTKRLNNGGGHTGWSCAWLIALYARLKNTEKAYHYLHQLLAKSSYPNLFDLHPPLGENFDGEKEVFQIDGNFGGVAAIKEMLVFNIPNVLQLLPAVPDIWASGYVSGIVLYNGHKIMVKWNNNKLSYANLVANRNENLKLLINDTVLVYENDKLIQCEKSEDAIIIPLKNKCIYTIRP